MARRDVLVYLRDINDAARMALQMLENLLEIARLRDSSESPRFQVIHIAGVLNSVRTMVSGLAATKRIAVGITCEPNLIASAEPRSFQSIIQNLVSNAIKFTPPDGTVSLRAGVEQGVTVIRVRDSGVGMSQERVSQLLGGESIGSTRGTAGESGIGWGLRLCREFCQVNHATLGIHSTVGQGTEFTVQIG